jgi:hypothetical protein
VFQPIAAERRYFARARLMRLRTPYFYGPDVQHFP